MRAGVVILVLMAVAVSIGSAAERGPAEAAEEAAKALTRQKEEVDQKAQEDIVKQRLQQDEDRAKNQKKQQEESSKAEAQKSRELKQEGQRKQEQAQKQQKEQQNALAEQAGKKTKQEQETKQQAAKAKQEDAEKVHAAQSLAAEQKGKQTQRAHEEERKAQLEKDKQTEQTNKAQVKKESATKQKIAEEAKKRADAEALKAHHREQQQKRQAKEKKNTAPQAATPASNAAAAAESTTTTTTKASTTSSTASSTASNSKGSSKSSRSTRRKSKRSGAIKKPSVITGTPKTETSGFVKTTDDKDHPLKQADDAHKVEEDAKSKEEEKRENATLALLDKADAIRKEKKGSAQADLSAAIALYKQAAEMGTKSSGRAFNNLGEIHLLGLSGHESSFSRALELFNKGADLGDPHCQHNIGLLHSLGVGVGNRSDAKALLNDYFAAVGGSHRARMALGYRHLHGYGVPQSCDAAIKYYLQVAEKVVEILSTEDEPSVVIERSRLSDERSRIQSPDEDEDVIQYYQHSADNGDVGAQVALGQLHFYGARGVNRDPPRAAQYFRAAAQQGDAAAMANLGQMHAQGVGVKQDNATALKYFQQAANKGSAAAQNGMGFLYMHGRGVKQNYKEALRFFKLSADQGNADAQFNLGVMYFAGLGVNKNYQTAMQYFSLAGHQGHTRALFNLGQMHMNGFGTVANCKTAIRFLKTVAERGPWATVLSEAHRNFLKGDLETAFMQYARAAEEGFEIAQSNSAWLLDNGQGYSGANARHLALRHFKQAAAQGNVDAQRVIGDYYYYGLLGQPDYEAAAANYLLASDKNNAQSMFNLGYMHEHGVGLPKDYHLAKRYFDQAATTAEEAYIPVQLALLKLQLHMFYDNYLAQYFGEWDASVAKQANTRSAPAKNPSPNAQSKPATRKVPAGAAAAAKMTQGKTYDGAVRNFLQTFLAPLQPFFDWVDFMVTRYIGKWEDAILLLLCGALALVVYLRSRV